MGSDVCSSSTLRFHLILRNIGLIIALSPLTMYTIIILKPCKLIISEEFKYIYYLLNNIIVYEETYQGER